VTVGWLLGGVSAMAGELSAVVQRLGDAAKRFGVAVGDQRHGRQAAWEGGTMRWLLLGGSGLVVVGGAGHWWGRSGRAVATDAVRASAVRGGQPRPWTPPTWRAGGSACGLPRRPSQRRSWRSGP